MALTGRDWLDTIVEYAEKMKEWSDHDLNEIEQGLERVADDLHEAFLYMGFYDD